MPSEKNINHLTKLSDLEVLQMKSIQDIAENFGVGRIGKDNKTMLHHIINEDARDALKRWAKKYTKKSILLKNLGIKKLGTNIRLKIALEKQELAKMKENENDLKIVEAEEDRMNSGFLVKAGEILKNLTIRLGTYIGILNEKKYNSKIAETKENEINKNLLEIVKKNLENKDVPENEKEKLLDEANKEVNSLNFFTKRELLRRIEKEKVKGTTFQKS